VSHPFVVLVVLGIALRAVVWLTYGSDLFAGGVLSELAQADCKALLGDPVRLFQWEHTRLPTFAARKLLHCSLAPLLPSRHTDLLLISFADAVASALFYLILMRLSVSQRLGFAVALFWSVALIAWEYYRGSGTHNHINIAVLTMFLLAALLRFQRPGMGADFTFAGAAVIFCLTYGPALLIAPIVALGSSRFTRGTGHAAASLCVALGLPMAAVVAPAYKNHVEFGVLSPSTYLSLNMSQFAYIGMGYNNPEAKLNALLPELNPSPWWTWCYDRARHLHANARPIDALRGQCLDFDDPDSLALGAREARRLMDQAFTKSLVRDMAVAANESWLLRVGSPALMTSATEVVFARTTKKLWRVMFAHDPMGMLNAFLLANRSFFVWGPLMFDGVHHEPQHARAPGAINKIATVVAALPLLGVIGGAVLLLVTTIRLATRLLRGMAAAGAAVRPESFILCVFLIAFFAAATTMNLVSCCENGRQFQSMSPIPMVMGAYLLNLAIGWLMARRRDVGDRSADG